MAVIPLPLFSLPTISLAPALPVIGIGIGVGVVAIGATATVKFLMDQRLLEKETRVGIPRSPGHGGGGSTSVIAPKQVSSREYLEILTAKQFVELQTVMTHTQTLREIRIKDAEPDIGVLSLGRNAQPRHLQLYHWGSFSGNFLGFPPPLLVESPIFVGLFVHQGCKSDGSKGFVIYGNIEDSPPLLYILGWSKPAKGPHKVYVRAGLLPNMVKQPNQPKGAKLDDLLKNLLMDQIKNILDKLTEAHHSSSYDPETGAEAEADIRSVYPGSSWAVLSAKFFRRQH